MVCIGTGTGRPGKTKPKSSLPSALFFPYPHPPALQTTFNLTTFNPLFPQSPQPPTLKASLPSLCSISYRSAFCSLLSIFSLFSDTFLAICGKNSVHLGYLYQVSKITFGFSEEKKLNYN
jgi:hypothetical protein